MSEDAAGEPVKPSKQRLKLPRAILRLGVAAGIAGAVVEGGHQVLSTAPRIEDRPIASLLEEGRDEQVFRYLATQLTGLPIVNVNNLRLLIPTEDSGNSIIDVPFEDGKVGEIGDYERSRLASDSRNISRIEVSTNITTLPSDSDVSYIAVIGSDLENGKIPSSGRTLEVLEIGGVLGNDTVVFGLSSSLQDTGKISVQEHYFGGPLYLTLPKDRERRPSGAEIAEQMGRTSNPRMFTRLVNMWGELTTQFNTDNRNSQQAIEKFVEEVTEIVGANV